MSEIEIYIITNNTKTINYRASKLLELNNQYKVTLICRKAGNNLRPDNGTIFIKSRINIFSIFKKLKFKNLSDYLNKKFYFPSPRILYVKNVIRYLGKIIRNKKNARIVIITICPPHDDALVGYYLKKEFPFIRWFNDLQDLWTVDEYYLTRLSDKNKKKAITIEKRLFETADKTIVTNEFAEYFCHDRFHLPPDKVNYIYHPFNEFNFIKNQNQDELINRIRNRMKIRLAFVGGLFKEPKVPGNLLLNELKRFVNIYDWTLELNLIGSNVPEEFKNDNVEKLTIKKYPKLTHIEAYQLAAESDFMILLLGNVPNTKVIMHAKYSHYLATGNLILAFVPSDSFIQKSINSTNAGFFIDINSDIANNLNNVFNSILKNGLPEKNTNEIEKFSSSNFREKWINLITEQELKETE